MKKLHRIAKNERGIADGSAIDPSTTDSIKTTGKRAKVAAGYVISCRLAAEEVTAFDDLCAGLGATSRSEGVRLVVRMASGFLEFSQSDVGHLDGLRQELRRIGTGVNQIALAANRGRSDLVRAQWEAVDELRRSLPGVRNLLGQIVAERRREGVALFQAFVAEKEGRNG